MPTIGEKGKQRVQPSSQIVLDPLNPRGKGSTKLAIRYEKSKFRRSKFYTPKEASQIGPITNRLIYQPQYVYPREEDKYVKDSDKVVFILSKAEEQDIVQAAGSLKLGGRQGKRRSNTKIYRRNYTIYVKYLIVIIVNLSEKEKLNENQLALVIDLIQSKIKDYILIIPTVLIVGILPTITIGKGLLEDKGETYKITNQAGRLYIGA